MGDFAPCFACARHIRVDERRCPFCSAPHRPASPRRRVVPRISRARWLALGSALSGLGCTTAGAPASTALQSDGAASSQARDAAGDVSLDSALDPDEGSADDGATADDTSTGDDAFAASDALADADAGACTPPTGTFHCGGTNGATCTATQYCQQGSLPNGCFALPPQCESCPTCACLNQGCYCSADDAGHLTVSCGCYGSPPARRTRFAQV